MRHTRRWRPRWTIRLRLTLLYGLLFLVAGAALLGITYGLVASQTGRSFVVSGRFAAGKQPRLPPAIKAITASPTKRSTVIVQQKNPSGGVVQLQDYAGQVSATLKRLTAAQAAQLRTVQAKANTSINRVQSDELSTLLRRSGLALAIMALASIGLGWLMAGRALRPVRTMSSRARGISERNLHERLALEGPDDELKELAETFDGLLGRLETAFDSQRRFVANASHELRTPITLERALVEVALADPEPTIESLRDTCGRVLLATEQQERLIEALLTLARSQRGLESRTPVDLRETTAEVVRAAAPDGLRVETDLSDACTTGDQAMIERLVGNLIENAIRYNRPDGWVSAWTGQRDGLPTVEVTNAGPVIDQADVGELVKPFYRAGEGRNGGGRTGENRDRGERAGENLNGGESVGESGNGRGLGLGLSIVQAIAEAHGATLETEARPEGGLRVAVAFPATAPASND